MKKSAWFFGILSLGTFVMVFLTLHDMQTAQGIGLYFSILQDYGSRTLFDIIVDVLGIVLLFLFLFIPCLWLGWFNAKSFFRLLAAYLALLPSVDLGNLVHVLDPPGPFAFGEAFMAGDFLTVFLSGMKEISPVLRLWIPILCLLLMGNRMMGSMSMKKWQKWFLGFQIPLFFGVFLFPALSPVLSFAIQYFLLIACFDIWEEWFKIYLKREPCAIVLFGGLWLRGIYLMIQVMSVWGM